MSTVSTSKKSHAGRNVLVFFVVFIILEMLIIFGIGKVFKNKDVTPSIAGYSVYLTDSELTRQDDDGNTVVAVPKNVLVIASNGMPSDDKKEMAVLCEEVKGLGTGVFWLADVQANAGVDGVVYTISDGTNFYNISSSNVVGIASTYYETAGKVIKFVTNKFGMIVCAAVPIFLLVLIEVIIAIATSSSNDDEDEDEEEEPEQENDVKLDDFLFGGGNEGEQIARRRMELEEQANGSENNEIVDSSADDTAEEAVEEAAEESTEAADETAEQPVEEPHKVDPSYYEKAAALLDEAEKADEKPVVKVAVKTPEVQTEKPEKPVQPVQRKEPVKKPVSRTRAVESSANASLEELMKLMEQEQEKLKNSLK
jgi:hypothetical protein